MPNTYDLNHQYENNGYTEDEVKYAKRFEVNGSNAVYPDDGSKSGNGYAANGNGKLGSEPVEVEDEKDKQLTVGVIELFRFADARDIITMVFGLLAAIALGCAIPGVIVVFGDMTDDFIDQAAIVNLLDENWDNISAICVNSTQDDVMDDPSCLEDHLKASNDTQGLEDYSWIIDSMDSDFIDELNKRTYYYVIIGCCTLIVGYITLACFMSAAYRQGQKIRTALFHAILRQEIGWFDTHDTGELNTRLADDVSKIQEGLGDKLASFLRYVAQFLAGYTVAFIYGWELTLVITAAAPLIVLSGAIVSQLGVALTRKELNAYAKAGSIAEEVLGSIRTVVAFGGEKKECERYDGNLTEAKDFGIRKSLVGGLGSGIVYGIQFSSYGLAFWYGSGLVRDSIREGNNDYTAGSMLTVFYGVLMGAFSVGIAAPNIAYFSAARAAAYTIFKIIDMQPSIDSSSKKGKRLDRIVGNIEFRDVHFTYPSRTDVPILRGFSAHISVGQTVALVGSSGCGKSTTVQLLQRFYDPARGQVFIDGVDIAEMNVHWLRQQIGVVSQEPILFATTIGENISYGKEGVTQQDIEDAAKNANAHSFIMKLPLKYDTLVGERGAQLSGGQKQRIAIARALVRNPKILLLDEATSALDMESESIVQSALDKARAGRTTIVVAHRLSTIRTADVICGVDRGVISEKGTHDELMALGKIYHTLVTNQTMKEEEEKKQLAEGLQEAADIDDVPMNGKAPMLSRALSNDSNHLQRSLSVQSDTTEKAEEKDYIPSFTKILSLNSSEWYLIALGCVGALITGALQPGFAFVFAEVITVFGNPDLEEQKDESNLYSLMFVGLGILNALSMSLEGYMFGRAGETLTMRLRQMSFKGFLKQDMSYFDDESHSTGALCTRLSTDASAVQGATGAQLGMFIRSVSSLLGGCIIGFVYSWKLTLVFMAFAPFLIATGFIEMSLMKGSAQADKEALEKAGKIAVESIENIRTVATLAKERMFHDEYTAATGIPYRKNMKSVHLRAVAFAVSQSFVFFALAGGFRYGAYLIDEEGLAVENMFKVFGAIVFSAMLAGQVSAFGPDVGKAKIAAGRIMTLFENEPSIDSFSTKGKKPKFVDGRVSFTDVFFNYPTRPNVKILRGLNLDVSAGQTLALVGASGCGKSTSIQLIERFYDPKAGRVQLDDNDTTSLNVGWLRGQMGLVSQEPILFDTTIKDNIAYGDNSRTVSMEEVIEAARKANIHSFIASLPEGYSTNTGSKGTQLSGGQKQRIAIARALVRNPKILLLDEATSALDTESEKVVQEALDNARAGRTSIVIAHRLSTIYNADIIAVIHNGQVAEQGTHSELLAKKGLYYKLNTIQSKA